MVSKTMLLTILMVYIVDVSKALMCYNCTSIDPACGQTLTGDVSALGKSSCSGLCMISKTTMSIGSTIMDMYTRGCQDFCFDTCMNMDGITSCMTCCSDKDLCNSGYVEPASGVVQPEPPVEGLMCYDCSSMEDPSCGAMLGDTTNIQQTACSGTCQVYKTTINLYGTSIEGYTRSCSEYCLATCIDLEGGNVCSSCCSATTLCNADYVDPSQTVNPTPTPVVPQVNPTPTPVVPQVNPTPTPVIPQVNPTPTPVIPQVNLTPTPVIPQSVGNADTGNKQPEKGATPPTNNDVEKEKDGVQHKEGAQQGDTVPPVQDMTTKSSAINAVVNIATIFLTCLCTSLMY